MTLSKRYHARPTDVLTVRLTCSKCKASLCLPITDRVCAPEYCPSCNARWIPRGSIDEKVLEQLLWSLSTLQSHGTDTAYVLEMEFEPPGL